MKMAQQAGPGDLVRTLGFLSGAPAERMLLGERDPNPLTWDISWEGLVEGQILGKRGVVPCFIEGALCLVSRAIRTDCSTSSTGSSSAHHLPMDSIQTRTPHHQPANRRVNRWWQQQTLLWLVCWTAFPRVAHSNLWQGCQGRGGVELWRNGTLRVIASIP